MNQLLHFLKRNYIALLVGLLAYGGFLYWSLEGNRICDCETTTKTSAYATGSRAGINRFYHK